MIAVILALSLTEDKAVEIGVKNYPLLIADSLDIESFGSQVKEQGASLWPSLELNLGYSYNSYVSRLVMLNPVRWREAPPGSGYFYPDSFRVDTIEFGGNSSYRFSLTLSRVLWTWGRMEKGYFIQKKIFKNKWKDYEAKKLSYEYTVRQVYVFTQLSKEALNVAEDAYRFAEENFKLVKDAYESGRASRLDYLRAKVNLRNAEYSLLEAKKSYDKAISNLRLVLGLEDTVTINLEDTLSLPENPPDTTLRRVDVEYLKEQAELLKEVGNEEKKAFLPTLFGSVTYNYQRPIGFEDKWGSLWVATLGLNWTLFNGFKPYHSYKRFEYQAEALRRRAAFLKQKARTDMRVALSDYEKALKKLEAAKDALSMAEESFKLAQEAYRSGRISYTDLKQVENSYEEALLNYKRAVADVRLNYWKAYYLARTSLQ